MLEDLRNERLAKLKKLQDAGIDPYPPRTGRGIAIAEVLERFSALVRSKKRVALRGRVMSIRDQGKLVFLDLVDETGRIQGVLKGDACKEYDLWRATLDRGDFIAVSGVLFVTKRGEKSIEVRQLQMLAKSVLPIPTEWYGIEDAELRLRERHLDLLLNAESRELFRKKSNFWNTFRSELASAGFLEVEAPVLEATPGGAEAEPFTTHHNALDTDFYLRISLELPLKRLLVGGYEKVFEIGRIFRNEGIDRDHLQDYTQLEFYWAYTDYRELMRFIEKLYKRVVKATAGTLTTKHQGHAVAWGKKWKTVEYVDAFRSAVGIDPRTASRDELYAKAKSLGVDADPRFGKGRLIDMLFKKKVRPTLLQPCFLVRPPVEIEPLAKRDPDDPRVVERFQVVAGGVELGKGFSELNDPIDQRARFEEQVKLRAAGDPEAQMMDEDFVRALEYGMPPASGFGISERLFAFLMDKPVRETVIFPLMRREK